MERSQGIAIRLTKLTDTSLIIHWFTSSHGLVKTVAKGARRPKSPFAGKLDLFFSSEIQWRPSRSSDLHTLRVADPIACRESIRQRYHSTLLAAYFAHLLEIAVEPQHPEPDLHDLLRRALDHVASSGPSLRALNHFECELAHLLGLGADPARAAATLRENLGKLPPQRLQLLDHLT